MLDIVECMNKLTYPLTLFSDLLYLFSIERGEKR